MAEETKDVPTTEAPAAEGETKQENGKKQVKRNETPIEELFDLTKPIPRVREPHDFASIPCVGFLRTSSQQNRHFMDRGLIDFSPSRLPNPYFAFVT